MTFDYDAYEKVFPKTDPAPVIDSAVDGYTPTADELAWDSTGGTHSSDTRSGAAGNSPGKYITIKHLKKEKRKNGNHITDLWPCE